MAGEKVPSTSAHFKVGQQTAKGTPATKVLCGSMQMSGLNVTRDPIDKGGEHGCPTGPDRATVHKSRQRYSSFIVNGSFRSAMYPDLIGYLLLGSGFTVVTTAGSGATLGSFSHVFTLAARTANPWLTFHEQIGSKTRIAVDARVNRLTFTANAQGFRFDGTLQALKEDEVAGTGIVTTNEEVAEILATRGTMTLNYDPDGTPVTMLAAEQEGFSLVINNPFDQETQRLFVFGRGDLPQTGLDVTGTVEGLNVDYLNYERIKGGGVGGDIVSDACAIAKLDTTFQSTETIAASTTPYSIRFEVPHAEVELNDFQAEGINVVDWTFPWRMVDDNAAPIRITLVNALPSYAA
jgi:hypothetical protein